MRLEKALTARTTGDSAYLGLLLVLAAPVAAGYGVEDVAGAQQAVRCGAEGVFHALGDAGVVLLRHASVAGLTGRKTLPFSPACNPGRRR